MWMSFVLIMSGITATFYYASIGGLGDMPDLKVLENPKTNLNTIVSPKVQIPKFKFKFSTLQQTS